MRTLESLFRSFVQAHPEGAARALEGLSPEEAAQALSKLPPTFVGPVVECLIPESAGAILDRFGPEPTRKLLEDLSPRHAATVLQYLDEARRDEILSGAEVGKARELRELTLHAPETSGGMMDTRVISIASDLTVGEAIKRIRKAKKQRFYYLYVTTREKRLLGTINLKDLVLNSGRDPIEPLVNRDIVTLPATMHRNEVARIMQQKKLFALPVVDSEGRLLGAVRHDEVIRGVQEEAFDDLQKMVGAGPEERALSPLSVVVKRRLPWLYVNLFTAFLAAGVVGLFEGIIAQVTALAVLLPVVAGQAGNTGSQSLAVVMRGLALQEVVPGVRRRLVLKETMGALFNGLAIGVFTALVVLAWSKSWALALVIGVGMVMTMTAAGLAGALIPLGLKALGRDPAQSSSIFLTTVTDVVGFASFLGLAALMAGYLT